MKPQAGQKVGLGDGGFQIKRVAIDRQSIKMRKKKRFWKNLMKLLHLAHAIAFPLYAVNQFLTHHSVHGPTKDGMTPAVSRLAE